MEMSKFQQRLKQCREYAASDECKFGAALIDICIKNFNASFNGDEGAKFKEQLFNQFKQTGMSFSGENIKDWILKEIKFLFKYISYPPKWVGDEPDWPFIDGKPMIFIGQINVPVSEETPNPYAVYIFQSKVQHDVGFEIVHRVVIQYPD